MRRKLSILVLFGALSVSLVPSTPLHAQAPAPSVAQIKKEAELQKKAAKAKEEWAKAEDKVKKLEGELQKAREDAEKRRIASEQAQQARDALRTPQPGK